MRRQPHNGDGTGVAPNRNHYTNEVESKLGTDPWDATCPMPLRIAVVPDGAGGRRVRITFPTVVGKVYQVEYGVGVALPHEQWYGLPDCDGTIRTIKGYTRWEPLAEVVGNGQEAAIFVTPPQPGEAVQYRYRYLREVDQDGDGIGLWTELRLRTRDDRTDSDQDRLGDLFEVQNRLRPDLADTDKDGLDDGFEHRRGRNPLVHDENFNGRRDGLDDWDADGVSNEQEIANGTSPDDFFNGLKPTIQIVSGNEQLVAPSQQPQAPLVVRLTGSNGQAFVGAPVQFLSFTGSIALYTSSTMTGPGALGLSTKTNASGEARVYANLAAWDGSAGNVLAYAESSVGPAMVEFRFEKLGSHILPPSNGLRTWLKADEGITLTNGKVTSWAGRVGTNSATSSGNNAPGIAVRLGVPVVEFDGSDDRMALSGEFASNFTLITASIPDATRTVHAAATHYAARNAGATGQRYLLAGQRISGANPWPPPRPPTPADKKFSRWENKMYTNTPYGRVYTSVNCSPSSFPLPAGRSDILKRYDYTDMFYRENCSPTGPYVRNPTRNWSPATCQSDFLVFLGNHFQNWDVTRIDDGSYENPWAGTWNWREFYYIVRATNYRLPYLHDNAQPTGAIGNVGVGLSLGTNEAGLYELRSDYHPCKGSFSLSGTSWRVLTVRYSANSGQLYELGAHRGSTAGTQSAAVMSPRFLGGSPDVGNYFDGAVAEVLIYDRAITDQERNTIDVYLANRLALPLDSDGNGLEDAWEHRWFGAVGQDPKADSDQDGLTLLQEQQRRTDPTRPDTEMDGCMDNEVLTHGTNPLLVDTDGDGFPDAYELRISANPLNPANGNGDAQGNGLADGVEYLRLLMRQQADKDNDGLWDALEAQILSPLAGGGWGYLSPSNPDSDGDGILDGLDSEDGDTLPNAAELELGTDPNRADTDGDGATDSEEIAMGTNPLFTEDHNAIDSDGDGLSDLLEITYGSNPNDPDTNDNGMNDGQELANGGNPSLPGAPAPPPLPPPIAGPSPGADPRPNPPPPLAHAEYEILMETSGTHFPKHGHDTFKPLQPAKRFKVKTTIQRFSGGNPESGPLGVRGTRTVRIDPLTGQISSAGPGYVVEAGTAQSPVFKQGSWSIDGYDDPPNSKPDEEATITSSTRLTEENTTENVIALAKANLRPFQNRFEVGTPFAYRNVHENELAFDYQRVQFKFRWKDGVTPEQRFAITSLLLFQPEDDPDTEGINESIKNAEIIETITWNGQAAESRVFTIDPDQRKKDVDGFYSLLRVQITKTWSDQFPGSDANQLPNKPTPSHVGSGSRKHKYILVGGRNPGRHVYVKAKVDFPDFPELKSKFKFALARMSGDVPFIKGPSTTIDENGELLLGTSQIDAVGYSTDDPPEDYAIVGGYDADGNGLANSEVGYISEYRIRPVSLSAYDGNRAWLSAFVIGGWIVNRPISAEFLQAFRTGNTTSVVGGSVVNETMSIEDDDHPDHHVGIAFTSANSGPIRKYVWSQYSMLAYEIAASQAVTDLIRSRLASLAIKSEVQSYSWQPDEFQKAFTWTLHPTQNDVLLIFPEDDLHTSFGRAWLKQARIRVTVNKDTLTATSIVVEGTLTDLYDWNYDEGFETDRRAATVQAGYNTLGPGGWIFRLHVDMDTASPLPSPSYNFK